MVSLSLSWSHKLFWKCIPSAMHMLACQLTCALPTHAHARAHAHTHTHTRTHTHTHRLLSQLPEMFSANKTSEVILEPVIRAGMEALKVQGSGGIGRGTVGGGQNISVLKR